MESASPLLERRRVRAQINATPAANNEYSRGSGASNGGSRGDSGPSRRAIGRRTAAPGRGAAAVVLAGSLLGALLLLVAEFTSLYQVHVATSSTPIESISGGSNHSYAMIPIALLGAALGIGVWRSGSRPALLAVGVIGIVAVLIALVGDLPDAQATGLSGSATSHYVNASSTPSAGLYLETLGGVLFIATCGLGFLMLGPRARARPRSAPRPRPPADVPPIGSSNDPGA